MLFARPLILTLVVVILATSNCSRSNQNSNNSATGNTATASNSAPKDNIEEFADIVRLPFAPEEVSWKETSGGKGLTAIVRFSPENAAKMSTEAAKGGQPTAETITVESWYPAELIAQSELTGESTVSGQSYPAEPYLNPPFTKGKIIRVEGTDYFILQLSS